MDNPELAQAGIILRPTFGKASASETRNVADRDPASEAEVVTMAELRNDNTLHTPELLLEECLREVRSGKLAGKKVAVIFLDDDAGFLPSIRLCNLKCSELLALLDVMKCIVRKWMGL